MYTHPTIWCNIVKKRIVKSILEFWCFEFNLEWSRVERNHATVERCKLMLLTKAYANDSSARLEWAVQTVFRSLSDLTLGTVTTWFDLQFCKLFWILKLLDCLFAKFRRFRSTVSIEHGRIMGCFAQREGFVLPKNRSSWVIARWFQILISRRSRLICLYSDCCKHRRVLTCVDILRLPAASKQWVKQELLMILSAYYSYKHKI